MFSFVFVYQNVVGFPGRSLAVYFVLCAILFLRSRLALGGVYVCFTIHFVHFISARVWLCILSCFRYGFYEADWPGPICLVKIISQTRQNTQPSPCINKTNKIFGKTFCLVCDIVFTKQIGPGRVLCLFYYLVCPLY